MPPAVRGLRLLSLNVNGVGGPDRAARLAWFLASVAGHPDVVMLQEVKCKDLQAFNQSFNHFTAAGLCAYDHRYFSLGTDASCGVAVFLKAGVFTRAPEEAASADDHGRIVRVDVDVYHHKFSFVSVYAPQQQKTAFFSSVLPAHLPQDRIIVMGGDYNCIMDADLDQTNAGTHRLAGSQALSNTMQQFDMHDCFRLLHPNARAFSHTATTGASAARLDRVLVSGVASNWVSQAHHVHGVSDHAGVRVDLVSPGTPTLGPGLRSIPRYLLYDSDLCSRVRTRLEQHMALHPPPSSESATPPQQGAQYAYWAGLKDALRDIGITVAEQHSKEQRKQVREAQHHLLQKARSLHALPSSATRLADYREAASALQNLVDRLAHKASVAMEVMWQDHGERCTAWHFDQHRTGCFNTSHAACRHSRPATQTVLTAMEPLQQPASWQHFRNALTASRLGAMACRMRCTKS